MKRRYSSSSTSTRRPSRPAAENGQTLASHADSPLEPGRGDVTGLSLIAPETVGKQLELLRDMAPRVSRVAILWNPTNPSSPRFVDQAKNAARTLGFQPRSVQVRRTDETESASLRMSRERAGALLTSSDVVFIRQRAEMVELAATYTRSTSPWRRRSA